MASYPALADAPVRTRVNYSSWTRFSAIQRPLNSFDRFAQGATPVFLVLFLASALLNVLIGVFHEYRVSPQAMDMDEQEYYAMSGQILAGHWDLGSRRTELYPLVIAGLRLIDSNFTFVQIAVSVLAALSAPLLYILVRRLSGSARLGLVSGILMMLWPMQAFLATSLYSETLALPCFLLFMLTLPLGSRAAGASWQAPSDWQKAPDWRAAKWPGSAILAGLALGVTAHMRPMYLLFLPFALVIPFLEERSLRRAARTALLVGLGFTLMVLPWSVWMSSRYHQPIILTANGGETLAGGLNPRLAAMTNNKVLHVGTRDAWLGPGKWLPAPQTGYLSAAEIELPYEVQSRLLSQRALAWMAANPGDAIRIELCKLGYMWGFYPWHGDSPTKLLAGSLPILALLGLAVTMLLRGPGHWLGLARLLIVPLFASGVALISWGSWRFRQPADAALLAFCVIAIGMTLHRQRTVDAGLEPTH